MFKLTVRCSYLCGSNPIWHQRYCPSWTANSHPCCLHSLFCQPPFFAERGSTCLFLKFSISPSWWQYKLSFAGHFLEWFYWFYSWYQLGLTVITPFNQQFSTQTPHFLVVLPMFSPFLDGPSGTGPSPVPGGAPLPSASQGLAWQKYVYQMLYINGRYICMCSEKCKAFPPKGYCTCAPIDVWESIYVYIRQ